jgi:hypothetical protein
MVQIIFKLLVEYNTISTFNMLTLVGENLKTLKNKT